MWDRLLLRARKKWGKVGKVTCPFPVFLLLQECSLSTFFVDWCPSRGCVSMRLMSILERPGKFGSLAHLSFVCGLGSWMCVHVCTRICGGRGRIGSWLMTLLVFLLQNQIESHAAPVTKPARPPGHSSNTSRRSMAWSSAPSLGCVRPLPRVELLPAPPPAWSHPPEETWRHRCSSVVPPHRRHLLHPCSHRTGEVQPRGTVMWVVP